MLQPEIFGNGQGIYILPFPPLLLGGASMKIAVVEGAEARDIFVADFLA